MSKRIGYIIDEIVDQYLYADETNRPWIIGFSGGKDSTALLTLVWLALRKIRNEVLAPFQLRRPIYVVCNDTLVENPIIATYVDENKISKANFEKNIDNSWKEVLRLTNEMSALQDKVAQGRAMWTKEYSIEQKRLELELNAQQEVYTQLRTQLELLKVDMQTETPVFQVLERPSIPDIKSGPSRGKLCIIVTMAAFFVSIFLAFLLNAIQSIRKDPVAMAKLHPNKKGK